jgi:hypothetical protein
MRKQRMRAGRLSISPRQVLILVLCTLVLLPSVASQPALSITVSTTKLQYSQGDSVSILGVVRDNQNNPISGASVSIQVNDPSNNTIHIQLVFSDPSGAYVDSLSLPADSAQGQYTVYASANKAGYSNGLSRAQFSVLTQTTASTQTTSSKSSTASTSTTTTSAYHSTTSSAVTQTNSQNQCLIATATYGSELAPEVVLLRNFRDFDVLQTIAGYNFMKAFNAFYYSFSPGAASFIAAHSTLRPGMKVALYPLIAVLYFSSLVFAAITYNVEVAVVVAGMIASFGIGAIYLGPILVICPRFFKSRSRSRRLAMRIVSVFVIFSVAGVMLAEIGHVTALIELTTGSVVLCSIALGGLVSSWTISRLWLDRHM